jgi:hypothetical protein
VFARIKQVKLEHILFGSSGKPEIRNQMGILPDFLSSRFRNRMLSVMAFFPRSLFPCALLLDNRILDFTSKFCGSIFVNLLFCAFRVFRSAHSRLQPPVCVFRDQRNKNANRLLFAEIRGPPSLRPRTSDLGHQPPPVRQ